MRLSKRKLKRIIREEVKRITEEDVFRKRQQTGERTDVVEDALFYLKKEAERFMDIEDRRGNVEISRRHDMVQINQNGLEYPITIDVKERRNRPGVKVTVGSEISVSRGRGTDTLTFKDPENIYRSRRMLDAITEHDIFIDEYS